jgi:hypothetical protein
VAADEGPRPPSRRADERPIDVSQDLGEETGDRDRGYGFAIEDGDVVQLDPDDEEPDEE